MESPFSRWLQSMLVLFLFLYTSPVLLHARHPPKLSRRNSTVYSAKGQAEKLIRALNLFPKHEVNLVAYNEDSLPNASGIVEKQLKLHILGDPGPSVQDLGHHAGYYRLPNTVGARMFYFFFESRNSKNDPVVIWLTGGPGCSSELALFYENGPFQITSSLALKWNDFGWDKASNLIYVDQPTGTGFSYSTSDSDIRTDEAGVSNDLYNFLQAFFKAHPEFAKNDFYITGESYAGHYIPAFASRVHQGNNNNEGIPINLKGLAIGNGLTNPAIQYTAYPEFALANKLIQQSDYDDIKALVPDCVQQANSCDSTGDENDCLSAYSSCNNIFESILEIAGNINYYDIRKTCQGQMCYDFSRVGNFLNQDTVKKALGVGDIDWISCSTEVYQALQTDWMRNLEKGIPALLENGIRVLVYVGEEDLICNWLGNSWWVNAIKWSGQKQFVAAPSVPFTVEGSEAGELKSHGPLSFLKVHSAGHMVPMDQPKAALEMLKTWMQGNLTLVNY
ncbi:hypothetical protein K2173_023586 [Erythroxylum novogranatense]|uniref:Carboxypeptidase n=1 Tax=Erythroxylum novogranatense TaxID=1862640 RepID=A0AAV8TNY8_9ROSI|nr:hypothetical protein K2173_023586 [Erythroxylum novogranatense]